MADSKEHVSVPVWDGSARTWRRYTREVAWFVQSTPVHNRRYCASKLLGRLSGPARLLAMSWGKLSFDKPGGTRLLLQRLAASPLVRKNLPNAAAICTQYFSFTRRPNEGISGFLVRESLVHEKFCEAIIRLHEDRKGVSQESRDFGLPPDEDETYWQSWWGRDDWGDWGERDSPAVNEEALGGDRGDPDGERLVAVGLQLDLPVPLDPHPVIISMVVV